MDYTRTRKTKNRQQKKITNEVKDTLCGEKINLIKLQWKEDIVTDGAELRDEDGVRENYQRTAKGIVNHINKEHGTSRQTDKQRGGLRKLLANRYDDFLWPALCKK
jgi:hypothetical protein